MKVKCLTSMDSNVFAVGKTYEAEKNEIWGDEIREGSEPWFIGNDLKILTYHLGIFASFEEATE